MHLLEGPANWEIKQLCVLFHKPYTVYEGSVIWPQNGQQVITSFWKAINVKVPLLS